MRKHFIVDPEFESLPLLNDVESEPIQSERILKGDVGWEFVFEKYFTIHCDFDFAGDEREVKDNSVMLVFQREIPSESLFASFNMLSHFVNFEPEGLNLLHLN